MVSSMRPDTSARDTCEHTGTVESAMFSQDDWSCVDVANPNSSIVDNMYQVCCSNPICSVYAISSGASPSSKT